MTTHKVLYVKRDGQDNATEVSILYEGLEICYISIHYIKDGKEVEGIKEISRVYIFSGKYKPKKMIIPMRIEQAIRNQAWAIFYQKKKMYPKKLFIPNEDKLIEEALFFNSEINAMKKTLPKKSFTEIAKKLFSGKAKSVSLKSQNSSNISYAQKKMLFDLNKVGIFLSKEGWIIIYRRERNKKSRCVVFDIETAIRMQGHILDSYIGDACNTLGEIPKVRELMELTGKINNLLIDWENSKNNKLFLKEKINSLIDELSRYRNELKAESKDILKSFAGLTDSRGQENPAAFAAKTIAVLNRLKDRLTQIRDISPIIERRKIILKNSKCFLETEKMRAEKGLIEFLKLNNFTYYSANGINEIRINEIICILDSLMIEPFASRKIQAVFYLQASKRHILETKKSRGYLREALAVLQT